MFRKQCRSQYPASDVARRPMVETLEDRRLLSASAHGGFGGHGRQVSTIQFSQAPAAVQTGLDNLASSDGLAAPTTTQTVYLSNARGVERYSVDIPGTGTDTVLTVDAAGAPVTAPTASTTTFGALSSSNAAVSNEISAIATALGLTAPTSTTTVHVETASGSAATYAVTLAGPSGTFRRRGTTITLDGSGNPVGNQNLPFSVIPAAIQSGLNAHAPSGATALTTTSTQTVQVRTANGLTTYSTPYTVNGTTTTVTVDATGAMATLPTTTSTTFGAIPAAAQTELQTLANADGFTGAIASTTVVSAYNEANGTTIYTVTLPANKTGESGQTFTINITLSVDELGNPTTVPTELGSRGGNCDGDNAAETATGSTGETTGDANNNGFLHNFSGRRQWR